MKIKLIFITTILLSCGNSSDEIPRKIIPIQEFTAILKDIHLIEAKHDLLKIRNATYNDALLKHDYDSIYTKHNIIDSKFKMSLEYYAERPVYLENIYSDILNQIDEEKINLNP